MPVFQTLVHPTDFDEPSKEAFRVARSLAQALGARLVVFHVVPRPAIVTQDGRVILDPHNAEPIDLWAEYRTLQADGPNGARPVRRRGGRQVRVQSACSKRRSANWARAFSS